MVLEGGVAGAQPLHKGGPKARPPKYKERVWRSEESETPSLAHKWERFAFGCVMAAICDSFAR